MQVFPGMKGVDLGEISAVFLTYVVLAGIRLSGIAAVIQALIRSRLSAPEQMLTLVQFVFYDYFFFVVIGLLSSGALILVSQLEQTDEDYRRVKLVAATGVGVPALIYLGGGVAVLLL